MPLAVEFGKKRETIGFDLSQTRVESYRNVIDPTGEVSSEDLCAAAQLAVTTDPVALAQANFIIVVVLTPVDLAHQSGFRTLKARSNHVYNPTSDYGEVFPRRY